MWRFLPLVLLGLQAGAQTIEEKVDQIFAKWNGTTGPGCSLAVIRDGKAIYQRGYGMADLDHDVPLRADSVFHVASVSKQFTAASIVLLAQQGRLSLDDPLRKHLPETPDFGPAITLRQLIHHTSGLRDQWDLLGLAGWRYSLDLITDDDVMSVVRKQKRLNFPPGDRHLYCNTGYTLLGQVVKKVTGKSLRAFTAEAIFQPLGMISTHFRDDFTEIVPRQAVGYRWSDSEKAWKVSVTNFNTAGATSLLTTAVDLALWDRNFQDPKVGGPAFVEQMVQPGKRNNGESLDYAFGLTIGKYKGLRTVEHGGSDAGYRSVFLRFPDQRFAVACLCNLAQAAPSALARQVADLYLASQLEPAAPPAKEEPVVELTPAQLAAFAGLYWNEENETAIRAEVKDGKLMADVVGARALELRPLGGGVFRVAGEPVQYRFGERRLAVRVPGREKDNQYAAVPDYRPTEAQLREFAGRYRSEEIDPVYEIAFEGGKLELRRLKREPEELRPVIAGAFRTNTGSLRFQRDARGAVTGFTLNTGRIIGFEFRRER